VLVMAPLGIVTAVELAFAAMFVALLIWSLSNYLYVSFGHLHMDKAGEKVYVDRKINIYIYIYIYIYGYKKNKKNHPS
jgi:hypothetical protein